MVHGGHSPKTMEDAPTPVLEVRDLEVNYGQSDGQLLRAVNGVSFSVDRGRTLGIVGESGSGKTTVIRAILRIIDAPGTISGGRVLYDGRALLALGESDMGRIRGNRIAMIFQDPSGSLDPLQTIGAQFVETIRRHEGCNRRMARSRAVDVLKLVGVDNPASAMKSYPMEFSAGTIQRMMIGMAISCDPEVVLADEPTTGLGVVVQASVLAVLKDIQERLGTALVLITHDMGIVSYIADDVMVMYAGKSVEYSTKGRVLARPLHPYTLGLMRSIPAEDQDRNEPLNAIPGFPPDISSLPLGCPFVERCYRAIDICSTVNPPLVELEPRHLVACHSPVPVEERSGEVDARSNS